MKIKEEQIVQLFHIILIGGLFLYVGISKDSMPHFMYWILLFLGFLVLGYHMYKIFKKKAKRIWISLIHIILVGPLLIFIGINKENTSRKYYELLLMLGFAAIGYHGYYLLFPS